MHLNYINRLVRPKKLNHSDLWLVPVKKSPLPTSVTVLIIYNGYVRFDLERSIA